MSILFQGSLLPYVSKKLDMIDIEEDIMKTFSDYSDELPIQFIQISLPENHYWVGKAIKDIQLPPETLIVYKDDGDNIYVPDGNTLLKSGDRLVLSALDVEDVRGIKLTEINITEKHDYVGKKISDIARENINLIILIKRQSEVIIPRGDTMILKGDLLICNQLL